MKININLLSKSEKEVLKLRCFGFENKQIADKRCTSVHTVNTQTKAIVKKLNATNLFQAASCFVALNPDTFKKMVA